MKKYALIILVTILTAAAAYIILANNYRKEQLHQSQIKFGKKLSQYKNPSNCNVKYDSIFTLISSVFDKLTGNWSFYDEGATDKEMIAMCFFYTGDCGAPLYYRLKQLENSDPIVFSQLSSKYNLSDADHLGISMISDNMFGLFAKLLDLKSTIQANCECKAGT